MFGFGKKKKTLTPSFGTFDAFNEAYASKGVDFALGSYDDKPVGVSLNDTFCNKITIVNNKTASVKSNFVIPMMSSGNHSYIIHDPDGYYFETMSEKLKSLGYDIARIDFNDDVNSSRISLFEMVNIVKNPYWNALIFSCSIKCGPKETKAAHNIFMAMMQYVLKTQDTVTMDNLYELFNGIKENDPTVIGSVMICPASAKYMKLFEQETLEVRSMVFAKIQKYFFDVAIPKSTETSLFAVTASNKKTAIFVKRVPKEYQFLMTTFLFNVKTASVLNGETEASVILFDTCDAWYNRELINRISKEAGTIIDRGVLTVTIAPDIKGEFPADGLVLYAHSSDTTTIEKVRGALTIGNTLSKEELDAISKDNFKKKAIPEKELNKAPITTDELATFDGCIVIDTTRKTKPFKCNLMP